VATVDPALLAHRLPAPPRRLPLILALTALVSVLALCANRVHNGDVYLQLLGGRFVAQHGIALHDPFPTIAAGQPWSNQQWLSEFTMYGIARAVGLTGLTVVYALLLGVPLLLLLLNCRDRRPLVLVAGAALYFPALFAVIHPRAAALTLLCFSLLTIVIARGFRASAPRWRTVAAVAALFALWANLHGGFVAGLGLIALVALGTAVDRARGVGGPRLRRLAVAALVALAATFATPLGPAVWSYVTSFSNPALKLASTEWGPAFQSPPAMLYIAACAAFSAVLFRHAQRPRSLMPLVVSAGCLLTALLSERNLILIPPALFLQIAQTPRASDRRAPHVVAAAAATAALAGLLVWALLLGPARTPGYLSSPAVGSALRHPPQHGRIAALAGVGSYVLWRRPGTRVVIDGWLEHFTADQLRKAYAIVDGDPGAAAAADSFGVDAVITRHDRAARVLEAHGFVLLDSTPTQGNYLVRRRALCLNRASSCRR
jgi:hypothetical protein